MTGTTFTWEQLEALEKAIAEGVRRVKYQDKEVEYRSLEEMFTLANTIRAALCPDSGGGRSRRTVGVYGSGL